MRGESRSMGKELVHGGDKGTYLHMFDFTHISVHFLASKGERPRA
jgi:hypothetical protein